MILGKAIKHVITIEPTANHGFIVRIGCGNFAYNNAGQLINDLDSYLADPKLYENDYNRIFGPQEVATESEARSIEPNDPEGNTQTSR